MVEAGNTERFDVIFSDALALVGVPVEVTVPCMTVPSQIAQKLHACTAVMTPPRTNDRAHDLVHLQLRSRTGPRSTTERGKGSTTSTLPEPWRTPPSGCNDSLPGSARLCHLGRAQPESSRHDQMTWKTNRGARTRSRCGRPRSAACLAQQHRVTINVGSRSSH